MLRKYSVSYDLLTDSESSTDELDLIRVLQSLVNFMSNEDELLFGQFVCNFFERNHILKIPYEDFLKLLKVNSVVDKYR